MSDNEKIFLDFWKEFSWPEPYPIFYRLYHDEHGNPIVYTMEDLPGKYVEITQEQYALRDHRVRVIAGEIVSVVSNISSKLVKSRHGTPCHPNNVALTVETTEPHQCWSLKDVHSN